MTVVNELTFMFWGTMVSFKPWFSHYQMALGFTIYDIFCHIFQKSFDPI